MTGPTSELRVTPGVEDFAFVLAWQVWESNVATKVSEHIGREGGLTSGSWESSHGSPSWWGRSLLQEAHGNTSEQFRTETSNMATGAVNVGRAYVDGEHPAADRVGKGVLDGHLVVVQAAKAIADRDHVNVLHCETKEPSWQTSKSKARGAVSMLWSEGSIVMCSRIEGSTVTSMKLEREQCWRFLYNDKTSRLVLPGREDGVDEAAEKVVSANGLYNEPCWAAKQLASCHTMASMTSDSIAPLTMFQSKPALLKTSILMYVTEPFSRMHWEPS